MLLSIAHTTEYLYSEPAWDSFNELRLQPADDYRQTTLQFELDVAPSTALRNHLDYYGNMTHHFHLSSRHDSLRVTSSALVSTYPIPAPHPVPASILPELRHRFFEYLAPTQRVPLNQDWLGQFGAARLEPADEVSWYLRDLTAHLKARLIYQSNSTTVDTRLEEFAQTQTGVCQDFAHAMLAICRSVGIPARYVSGYVHSDPEGDEDMIGSEGSHAWVEAFLPGSGWVGYDPTNGCILSEAHAKLAVGRDYADVPPVSGLRRGGGRDSLNVTVAVRRAEREEAMPQAAV